MSITPVCIPCRVETRCIKNGASLVFGENWVYDSDLYRCPECGHQIAIGAKVAHEVPEHALALAPDVYYMKPQGET